MSVIEPLLPSIQYIDTADAPKHVVKIFLKAISLGFKDTWKRRGGDEWEEWECQLSEWRTSYYSWSGEPKPGICDILMVDTFSLILYFYIEQVYASTVT